ncbi:uncharacterized protein LOC123267333 [Cotesia glomerata]|uniref:uncharacterized protein LOC123267333 n=1 Tax=Cotesia glomerata TaxID=32391 RepID=UPI001D00481F|nr:uncharacterized protein LOC123267333 [Cotesia glomerata]
MIGLRGQWPRTLRFLHDGHMYHHDVRYNDDDEDYVCSLRTSKISKCPVVASVNDDGDVEVVGVHTHAQRHSAEELRKQEMLAELKRRAVASNEPPNEILNAVSRDFADIAAIVNPVSARAIINRERIQQRPPMPQTVHHVGPMLDRYLQAAEIYRGEIQASDGSIAIVFGSQQMLERLNDAVELFVDGTFQAVPDQPRFMQLLIIHVRKLDMGLPALFILCEKRTTAMYEKIWEFILDRSPEMENNLKYVSGDYEKALISSIRNKMRWVIFRGCWFHFTRAVTRRWRRLRLTGAPEFVLHLTWVLPLVPAHLFQEAFQIIRAEAPLIERNYPRIMFFIAYIETYWLPQAARVSTRNSVIRTNNVAEAFNRQLVTRLGGAHLNLFLFIERLTSIIKDEEIRWLAVDSRIINYQTALDNGRFTVAEFLRTVGLQRVHAAVADANIRLQDEDFDSDDEMPLLTDLADPVSANENLSVLPILPPIREARRRRRRGARRGGGVEVARGAVINNPQIGGRGRPRGRPRGARGGRQVDIPPIAAGIGQNQPVIVEAENVAPGPENNLPRDGGQNNNGDVYDRIEVNEFENDELADGNARTCSICLLNIPKIIIVPCFHLCLCFRCNFARQLIDADLLEVNAEYRPTCPVCRTPIDNTREVYAA